MIKSNPTQDKQMLFFPQKKSYFIWLKKKRKHMRVLVI